MSKSLFSHGLTTSKVNVSSKTPCGAAHGRQEWRDVKEGRRIPSWVWNVLSWLLSDKVHRSCTSAYTEQKVGLFLLVTLC